MSKACSDARLPHRIQDWAKAHGGRATEADADAIVTWLRSQRGLEYARKPAEGLRRQILRVLERTAPAAAPGGIQIGGAGSGAVGSEVAWSIDASPEPAAGKRAATASSSDSRPAKAARSEPEQPAAAPVAPPNFNLLNASVAKAYRAADTDANTSSAAENGTDAAPGADGVNPDKPDAAGIESTASADAAPAGSSALSVKKRPKRERRGGSERAVGLPGTSERPSVGYADLGGMEGPLQAVRELVEYPLTHPEIFAHLGVSPPRGLLLHGPPGCGKTLLACAIAGELGVGFVRVSAPEVVSGMSGESEAKIRQIFKEARDAAPALLFIDEIDAIAPKRESAQREMEKRIVAQMLTCMDELAAAGGSQFDSAASAAGSAPPATNPTVIVIGATNRPDALDPALRRAGRFDREISLGIPDAAARGRILQVMTRGMRLAPDVDVHEVARRCNGFVGADLAALCKEAAVVAVNRIFGSIFAAPAAGDAAVPMEADPPAGLSPEPASAEPASGAVNPGLGREGEREAALSRGMAASAALRRSGPLTAAELAPLSVRMADFEAGMGKVQPSAKREGFATVPDVSWADVGSLAELRQELVTLIVEPVREPGRMQALGLDPSCGVLLYGPPGCGKTLLAKAVANESGASFMSVSGPELLNKYVGESERAVRLLFARGRASAPCIIFFDELDALVPRRGSESGSQATERVVNQLLTEMDGLENRNSVFVVAATNRPDIIDPAMLRPGRLDKLLYVPLPPAEARADILRAASRKTPLAPDVSLDEIGRDPRCNGFSGADLAALVREAAVGALRDLRRAPSEAPVVTRANFDSALDVVRPSVSAKDELGYKQLSAKLRKRRAGEKPAPARAAGDEAPLPPRPEPEGGSGAGEEPVLA